MAAINLAIAGGSSRGASIVLLLRRFEGIRAYSQLAIVRMSISPGLSGS
jgi:hypothetical protein